MATETQSAQNTEALTNTAPNTEAAGSMASSGAAEAGSQATQAAAQVTEQVAAAASTTPPLPMESAFTWSGYIQAIGTLLLLLAVLWGVVWVVRKYGRFNFLPKPGAFPRDGLRIESQLPLGPRKGLMVVRFLNKRLLLGVTDHQITLLKETADDDNEKSLDFKELMDEAQCQKSDS